jgi:hypothetical protein
MKGWGNLGLRTSAGRVDQCIRVCTQGVQSIRPGVLRGAGTIGRGTPVGTAHHSFPPVSVVVSTMASRKDPTNCDFRVERFVFLVPRTLVLVRKWRRRA